MTAVMQPYLFPYLGYFQLVGAVDHFVFYDDVQYINEGWINRNRLPQQGWFTVPVAAGPLATPIYEQAVARVAYPRFRRKWLKGFGLTYSKAPFYGRVRELVETVFVEQPAGIAAMAERSVRLTAGYLGLATPFFRASTLTYDRSLTAQDRLLDLLRSIGADHYLNPAGGQPLYQPAVFAKRGVRLSFLHAGLSAVPDGQGQYSMLHLLAHYEPAQCRDWLGRYTITTPTAYAAAADHTP